MNAAESVNLGLLTLLCILVFIALGLTQYTGKKNNKSADDGDY